MNFYKTSLLVFFLILVSRLFPHPPNFTSLIALSFYIPALLGRKYIYTLIIGFIVSDLYFGMHQVILFTWGSIFLIGYSSKFFFRSFKTRSIANIYAAFLFFVITNFGVWLTGSYGYSFEGLITCYVMAIPFFTNTLISTMIYGLIIEIIYWQFNKSKKFYTKS